MDVEHMQPFVFHTINTFEVMLEVTPEASMAEPKQDARVMYDISAIIGISGSAAGAVVMNFPKDVACKVVSRMLGEELTEADQEVADGLGELVNIVAGNAKRDLVKYGFERLALSLPSVVIGKHRTVWRSGDLPCVVTQLFASELGSFNMEVSIHRDRQTETSGGNRHEDSRS